MENQGKTNSPKNSLSFIKEVAKYFMDFLETDFHKRRNPKRNVQLRNQDNLLIGLNLNKYPLFLSQAVKAVCSGFSKNNTISIGKGVYKTSIPRNLIELIDLQISKITKKQVASLIEKIGDMVEKNAILYKKEYDQALSTAMDETSKVIKTDLVLPFVSSLEKPLENLALGDENSTYLMEEELTAVLSNMIENKVSEIIKVLVAGEKTNVINELSSIFETKDIKTNTTSFFESFQVGDLFSEIYEIERNRTILDKQEFYLYFCDISYNKVKYPIFYIPFNLVKQNDSFVIEFDSQVYINKKALEFITQEYNKDSGKKGSLKEISERIIYLTQYQDNFKDEIARILTAIVNYFDLDNSIDISDSEAQVARNLWAKITNSIYVTLFDKSDEALINDYEEILQLLSSENNILAGAFNRLIEDFIQKEPIPFGPQIQDEWGEKETSEKLVYESPIPLNEEQLQILSALKKDECKYIIVQGPPGTGKSHTITAVVFNAILKNQSVLVLSDKKEALDVVEDKITDTLNKVRTGDNFQNPVLRLGKIGNAYSKILSPIAMRAINNNYLAVKKNYNDLETNIEKNLNALREDIEAEVLTSNEIDIQEIYEFVSLESDFEKNGFPLKVSELAEDIDSSIHIEDVRKIMLSLKDKLGDNYYNINLGNKPSEDQKKIIENKIDILTNYQESLGKLTDKDDVQKYLSKLIKDETEIIGETDELKNIEPYEKEINNSDDVFELLSIPKPSNFSELKDLNKYLLSINDRLTEIEINFRSKLNAFDIPINFTKDNIKYVNSFIDLYKKLRIPIIGYVIKKENIEALNKQLKLYYDVEEKANLHKYFNNFKQINSLIPEIQSIEEKLPPVLKNLDLLKIISGLQSNEKLYEKLKLLTVSVEKYNNYINDRVADGDYKKFAINSYRELKIFTRAVQIFSSYTEYSSKGIDQFISTINDIDCFVDVDKVGKEIKTLKLLVNTIHTISDSYEDIDYVNTILDKYSEFSESSGISDRNISSYVDNNILDVNDLDFQKTSRYLSLIQKIKRDFKSVPEFNYLGQKKCIENLLTVQMANIMDKRVIDFSNNFAGTAAALKKIIQGKTKFPRDEFLKLKNAFPCILAGIRDYSEYIPLEPDLFDLVIIDEASQVSIAQAFPALLRAKKVLILGDKKQFSNVKTAQARSDENRKYLIQLKDSFVKNISNDAIKLEKLKKFDIKTSILDFFEYIKNYQAILLKHFRSYKEIISYSDKYFYKGLQVMKIRGKAIDEVIRFQFIKHDGKSEIIPNTNTLEVEFIISELKKLCGEESNVSVGIITPHTNQQKKIVEMISKVPERDCFYNKLKLKIMTFDTCQGEERDVIFYSMVATETDDHLWGVFIKNLNDIDSEEDGKIKAQRLNVGLSRAKECMVFVLSKPIEKFNGSIGDALQHYANVLEDAKKEKSVDEVDKKSKMEPEVMNWFYQTDFWTENKDRIEFFPQFELGKYLNGLDNTYQHPKYKVDFLLIYKDETGKDHKIIIEYDGFKEHFHGIEGINSANYQDYYSDDDVYRQKTLESYGYKFLRINKFNIGKDPILNLNSRIQDLIKNGDYCENILIDHIHQTINSLENGEERACPKCKMVWSIEDFKDPSLISGYGRFCKNCKSHSHKRFANRFIGKTVSSGSTVVRFNESKDENAYINSEAIDIETDKKLCPLCNSKMILRHGRYGKFFGCTKFPYCKGTRKYE